jgi:hypothetical protein
MDSSETTLPNDLRVGWNRHHRIRPKISNKPGASGIYNKISHRVEKRTIVFEGNVGQTTKCEAESGDFFHRVRKYD